MNLEKMKADFEEAYSLCENLKNNTPVNDAEKLSHWILNTDISIYEIFVMSSDAELCRSIEGMACMHSLISHALFDDGEISFVSFNERPLIIRADPRDFPNKESFFQHLHKHNQPFNEEIYNPEEHIYKIITLSVEDFVQSAENYHKENIVSCFLFDIQLEDASKGVEQFIKSYQSKHPEIITDEVISKAREQVNWL